MYVFVESKKLLSGYPSITVRTMFAERFIITNNEIC